MPLIHSKSDAALKKNMHTLHSEVGRSPHVASHAQATAIALATQRRAQHRDIGGIVSNQDLIAALSKGPNSVNGIMPAPQINAGASAMPMAPVANPRGIAMPMTMMGAVPGMPNQQPANMGVAQNASITSGLPARPMDRPLMAHGGALQRADGGFNVAKMPHMMPSWETRSEARQMHVGPILSAVPGRTDNHLAQVPSGSYVLPAAHLASMGKGNSIAGLALAHGMFGTPYGGTVPRIHPGPGAPRPPRLGALALGGAYSEGGARVGADHAPVDVNLSGGEFVIPPEAIIRRFGSLKRGHAILDAWVMAMRKREIETLKKLPPPAKR